MDTRNLLCETGRIRRRVTNHRSTVAEDGKCCCIGFCDCRMGEVDCSIPRLLNLRSSHASRGIDEEQNIPWRGPYFGFDTVSRPEGQPTLFVDRKSVVQGKRV